MQNHMGFLFDVAKGNILEIGVRGGASTSALLAGVEAHGGHLWSVDVNYCKVFDHPQWTCMQANSITEAEKIKAIIPYELDVLFVDGDHSREGCLSDLNNYGPRAKLILIHDCLCPDTFPGVRQAAEEYAASLGVPLVIHDGSYGLGIIRPSWRVAKALAIKGWMTQEEIEWLAEQATTRECIVEIGSYQGRSTRALGDNAKGIVYAVDDWKGLRTVDVGWWTNDTPEDERNTLFERFFANVQDLIDAGKIKVIISDHAKVSELPLLKADMVFIDGGHDYQSVKRDIETWLPCLTKGGLMCGHDANQEQVMQAVNELLPGAVMAVGLIWKWDKA